MAHFSSEFRAYAPLGKFLRLKFSEMQSSAFRMQMPGFHIEHVMLIYLRKITPRQKRGPGLPGPAPKSALDPSGLNPPHPRTTFSSPQ